MKIFIAGLERNDWDASSFNIGAYSSEELAKKALLRFLREEEEEVLSLKDYMDNPERLYNWFIEVLELDK